MYKYKHYILALVVGVCIGAGLYVIGVAKAWPLNQASRQKVIASAPEVVSCVETIKVTKRTIKNAGTSHATVEVEVENTSDLGIIAVSLESKKGKDTYTVRTNTFEADEPTVVIKPHEAYTLTMELSNIFPNEPLQIGSVIYVDGTEEGCEVSLKAMRESKTQHEQQKAERKASPQ